MNYESFQLDHKLIKKRNNTFFRKFIKKLSNPNFDNSRKISAEEDKGYLKDDDKVIDKPIDDNFKRSTDIANTEQVIRNNGQMKRIHSDDLLTNKRIITRVLKSVKTNLKTSMGRTVKVDRGYWMPDSICHKCYNCEEEFTTIKRKHHCRMCGQIFCYYCCTFELPGSLWNLDKPQRACRLCFFSYYSKCNSKNISPRTSRLYYNYTNNQRVVLTNMLPRRSIDSDKHISTTNNLSYAQRNLSFSSNDLRYLSQHTLNSTVCDEESETEKQDELEQFLTIKKPNESEVDETSLKTLKKDHRLSFNLAYYKNFFPSHILSKEKIFGNKIFTNSHSPNSVTSDSLDSENTHKKALLLIWKLIIDESEKHRNYFNRRKSKKAFQRHSFPNDDEEMLKENRLPIVMTGEKSCIHGYMLINWMINSAVINSWSRAIAICQSLLEMELLSPFFEQDDRKNFRDDVTLYIIREFLAVKDPTPDSHRSFIENSEFSIIISNDKDRKSVGNSVFYTNNEDYDTLLDINNQETDTDITEKFSSVFKIKSPQVIPHLFAPEDLEDGSKTSHYEINNTNIWNRSCRYLENLLKQELNDYNLDLSWCNIILPICKLVGEKITPAQRTLKSIHNIKNFVQIKKIPDSTKNDCGIFYAVSMSKNIDYPMKKEIRNPHVILIRSSIDYWRHKKLVSLEPLLLQEEEYLKNCVMKIKAFNPDIVVVEGSVSLIAKDMMEKCGLILISNVTKGQMDRLSRMLDATIFDSVDSLSPKVESQLGKCSQFFVKKYTLTNGRTKHLLFFKLRNSKSGCSLLLHGKSLSELVRVKYVIKFIILAFKNAYLEQACLKNFQIRLLSSSGLNTLKDEDYLKYYKEQDELSSTFLDITENRFIPMSVNVRYTPPTAVVRRICDPELQNRLLSLDRMNLFWKEKLHNVLKRKQRHVCAEFYDYVRMSAHKHPLMYEPALHSFTNSCYDDKQMIDKDRCILYSDFRNNGSRFRPVQNDSHCDLDASPVNISTIDFDSSDLACQVGFLTKTQKAKWRDVERKKFDSIYDSFNPRNYQRILLLFSIQTRLGICEKARKISLSYYENTDRTLGNFVSSMLNDVTTCPAKCDLPIFDHVYKFVSNNGCLRVSVLQLEAESYSKLFKASESETDRSTIKLWTWCSRCDKDQPPEYMTYETWHLSLGRFFDILFNLNNSDLTLFPKQCYHSLQTDIHYYFTQQSANKVLEMNYSSISVHEFQTPELFIKYAPMQRSVEDLFETFKYFQNEIAKVTEIKTRYNLNIKEKLLKLKSMSKEKDNELWDHLKQDSNTEHYSQKIEDVHNLMEKIYSRSTEKFENRLFENHENYIKGVLTYLWADIVNVITKWDSKLNEAFEREEKNEKRTIKLDLKNNKNSSDSLLTDQESAAAKIMVNKSEKTEQILSDDKDNDVPLLTIPQLVIIDNDTEKYPQLSASLEEEEKVLKIDFPFLEVPTVQNFASQQSSCSDISFENIDEVEINSLRKEKGKDGDQKLSLDRQTLPNQPVIIPLKKLFSSFFHSNGYKVLEDPTQPNISYTFADIESVKVSVSVHDDFITSVVAFLLSSDTYAEMLNEYSKCVNGRDSSKGDSINRHLRTDYRKPSTEDMLDIPDNSPACERKRSIKIESISKNREINVRYFSHVETDDSDTIDQDYLYSDPKPETDDIKIEISGDDNTLEETIQKTISSSKQSNKNSNNDDFVINLTNHKVKCMCKIYFAKKFHDLRAQIFQGDELSYIRSLCECKSWATTGGKSGLNFRKTLDERFIIKQLQPVELEGFQKFQAKYFDYISERIANNEKSALAKIIGIYHVDYYNSLTKATEKMDFLIMENVFYGQKPNRIFDLKGKKLGATNTTIDKGTLSDNITLQDKDFINYIRNNPFYVSWQAQIALKETLTRDTDFLQSLPVMDYSLLVGVDDNNESLVIGIIDYLRMFTMNKLIEMHFKQKLLTPHGELPTVIQPQKYQKRFLEAMEEYFLVCPIPWDHLLLYPTNVCSESNVNARKNFSSSYSSLSLVKLTKMIPVKKSCLQCSSENQLRMGIISHGQEYDSRL